MTKGKRDSSPEFDFMKSAISFISCQNDYDFTTIVSISFTRVSIAFPKLPLSLLKAYASSIKAHLLRHYGTTPLFLAV